MQYTVQYISYTKQLLGQILTEYNDYRYPWIAGYH